MTDKQPEKKPERYDPLTIALLPEDQLPAYMERCFLRGEVSLAAAMRLCVHMPYPVPSKLAQAFGDALWDYWRGDCDDLAEPFGIHEPVAERKAQVRRISGDRVRALVDSAHKEGYPKSHPESGDVVTAFHVAAERAMACRIESHPVTVSALAVHRAYYRKSTD